jgi:mRNA-binding protein PUF3
LEHILSDQQAELIQELEPHVLRCIKDQNGNHVIQKAIQCLDARRVQFILDSIDGQVGGLANHPYGCRVIQRVLETCVDPAKRRIFGELHACGSTIISDQYGNYVAQNMMQHGSPEDRAKVISLVKQNLVPFAKHKFASNVVERCLEDGSAQQRRELMEELASKPDALYQLIRDSYGNYVIRECFYVFGEREHC